MGKNSIAVCFPPDDKVREEFVIDLSRIQNAIISAALELVELKEKGGTGENEETLFAVSGRLSENQKELESLIGKILAKDATLLAESRQHINTQFEQIRYTIFGSVLVALIIAFSIIFLVDRLTSRPIAILIRASNELATGNFKAVSPLLQTMRKSTDEFGEMGRTFSSMAESLHDLHQNLENKVKERTAELAKQTTKIQTLLASIGDGVIAVDRKGKVILVNRSAQEMLDWKKDDVFGKNCFDILHIKDEKGGVVPVQENPISVALTAMTITTNPFYIERQNGTKLPVSITAAPVMNHGLEGVIAVLHDITKEKEIDRAKTEFVSLAAHQLRTPLTSLKWSLNELLEGDFGELKKKQKELIGDVIIANKRLIGLVNGLLDVARLEEGSGGMNMQQQDIIAAIKSAYDQFTQIAQGKNIHFSCECAKDSLQVMFDQEKMGMALTNLIDNALKYTLPGGTVRISVAEAEKKVRIVVADTGIGIPKDQAERIFSKFYRAHNAMLLETYGTGLGLFVTKDIVEKHQGTISFKENEGGGSVFTIVLPRV